jgi:hypothetical protein
MAERRISHRSTSAGATRSLKYDRRLCYVAECRFRSSLLTSPVISPGINTVNPILSANWCGNTRASIMTTLGEE